MFYYIVVSSDGMIVSRINASIPEEDSTYISLNEEEYQLSNMYRKFNISSREFSEENPSYVSNIDKLKQEKVLLSKQMLADWLENNPIYSTVHNKDGEYYTVTQEKQTQLTQMITLATLAAQTGIPFIPTWNSTSNVCEEWTIEELTALTFEITRYVLPRVKKQQDYEVQIREVTTKEEVESIEIDYSTI